MNANLLFEQAMRNSMVERMADQSYSVIAIQHITDVAQSDRDVLEDVIVGVNCVFGHSTRFMIGPEEITIKQPKPIRRF